MKIYSNPPFVFLFGHSWILIPRNMFDFLNQDSLIILWEISENLTMLQKVKNHLMAPLRFDPFTKFLCNKPMEGEEKHNLGGEGIKTLRDWDRFLTGVPPSLLQMAACGELTEAPPQGRQERRGGAGDPDPLSWRQQPRRPGSHSTGDHGGFRSDHVIDRKVLLL